MTGLTKMSVLSLINWQIIAKGLTILFVDFPLAGCGTASVKCFTLCGA